VRSKKESDSRAFMRNRKNPLWVAIPYWASRWRSGLIRLLERALSGSNISDRLGGDLSQIQHLDEVAKQIQELQTVSSPVLSNRIEIDGFPTYQASLQRKMGIIKDCAVNINSGLIRLNSGFILDGALPHWQQLMYQGGFVHEYRSLRKPKSHLSGTYLIVPSAKYFYHFVIEDLPNISWALENYPECKVLLSTKSSAWQFEILENLSIPFDVSPLESCVIEKVVFVTAPRVLTSPDITRIQGFRKNSNSKINNLKIFVARGVKDRGDLKLENQLIDFLSSKGYLVIYTDEISFAEQRDFFERASRVISFHGGALTNLVWCQPQTKVLEIFNHAFRTYDYAKLCAEAQLDYYSLNLFNFDSGSHVSAQLANLVPKAFLVNE
jgi:hypothetical protein